MSNRRQAVFSVARVISAAFIALLLTGPPPWGWPRVFYGESAAVSSISLVLTMTAMRGFIAGLVAGRRLAVVAAILSSTWALNDHVVDYVRDVLVRGNHEFWLIILLFMVLWLVVSGVIAAFFGSIGGRLAIRARTDTLGTRSGAWVIVGFLAVLTVGCAYTLGVRSAARLLHDEVAKSAMEGRGPQSRAYVSGVFPAISVWSIGTGGPGSDMYITDPTGRILLGKYFLPHD